MSTSISELAKDDLELLIQHGQDAATHFLQKNKEFYPFAITLDNNQSVKIVHALASQNENPESQLLIDELKQTLQGSAVKAACLVYVATMAESEAIFIALDHSSGDKMQFILPYIFKGIFKKQLTVGVPQFTASSVTLL